MFSVKYIKDSTAHPLIVSGPSGCGKSVFISKIAENINRWKPEFNLVLRYANLDARSSDLVSMLGSIANQMSILAYGHQIRMDHMEISGDHLNRCGDNSSKEDSDVEEVSDIEDGDTPNLSKE